MKVCNIIDLKEKIFFLSVISLIFCTIPNNIQISISGGFSSKLSWYFIFVGFFIGLYEYYYTWRNQRARNYSYLKLSQAFICTFMGFTFFSLIWGLWHYPYYDQILNAPVMQFNKFPIVYQKVTDMGIHIHQEELLAIWMIIRPIKQLMLEIIYTFGVAFLVYVWSYGKWERFLQILVKATFCAVGIIFIYSCFEIPYLYNNNSFFSKILIYINPIIHEVKENGGWWPPLLWPNQLRSVFAEPSYFGIYASFAMPWLWYQLEKTKKNKNIVYIATILSLFSFCVFMTKARTAVVLFLCQIVLLVIFSCYLHKSLLRKTLIIIFCSMIGFLFTNVFIGNVNFNVLNKKTTYESQVESYLNDNLGSLQHTNQRSNRARFSMMEANFRMGLDYPILGVGYSLRQGYTISYLPEMAFDDDEVNLWIKNQNENGIIKSGFPCLGEYTTRFAETGLIGVVLFLLPMLYLLINILKFIFCHNIEIAKKQAFVCYTISFLGVLGSGIGESLNVTYSLWILLGLGYSMIANTKMLKSASQNNK